MITKGYEEIHNRLLAENEILRQNLATIQKDLVELMNLKKELFFRRRKVEYGDEMKEEFDFSDTNLTQVKNDLYRMPIEPVNLQKKQFVTLTDYLTVQVSKEAIETLHENIKKFKDFSFRMDRIEQDVEADFVAEHSVEIEKIKCVKNLKSLLSN